MLFPLSPALIKITRAPAEVLEGLGITPGVLKQYDSIKPDGIRVFEGGLEGRPDESAILSQILEVDSLNLLKARGLHSYAFLQSRLVNLLDSAWAYPEIISVMANIPLPYIETPDNRDKVALFRAFVLLHELGHFRFGGHDSKTPEAEAMEIERSCDAYSLYSLHAHSVPGTPDLYLDITRTRALSAVMLNFNKDEISPTLKDSFKYAHAPYMHDPSLKAQGESVVKAHKNLRALLKKNLPPPEFFPVPAPPFVHVYISAVKVAAQEKLSKLEVRILGLFFEGSAHFMPKAAAAFNEYGAYYADKFQQAQVTQSPEP